MNTKNTAEKKLLYAKLYLKNLKEQTKRTLLLELSKSLEMQKGLDPQANIDAVLLDTADGTKSWIKVVTFDSSPDTDNLDALYAAVAQECTKDFYKSSKTISKGTLLVVLESPSPVFDVDSLTAFIAKAYDKKRFNNSYRVPKSCFDFIIFGAYATTDADVAFVTTPVWQRSSNP